MNKEAIYEFLARKYVQRSDDRQKAMGLQYMEAETHDLAEQLAAFISTPPEPKDCAKLAEKIVSELFKLGSEPNDPCQRIEFHGGTWPNAETNNGGFNREGLVNVLSELINSTQSETGGEQ